MNELMSFWGQWLRPSAGLPTVQWALLLAVASTCGYLVYRHKGYPFSSSNARITGWKPRY